MDRSKTPIFDRLAMQLHAFDSGYHDEILCPLCLGRFNRLLMKELTKEHVVPKSLGGSVLTLTCKRCNNEFGHKVQSHLAKLIEINESFRGNAIARAKLTMFDQSVPVNVRLRDGIHLEAAGGDPKAIEAINAAAKTRLSGKWSLSSHWKYSPWKGSTAIARTAYLIAFEQYGYPYLLSPPVKAIREEISTGMDVPSGRLCALTGTCKIPTDTVQSGFEPQSLVVPVIAQDDQRFLFVLMRLRKQSDYFMFCVLPVLEQPVETMFRQLNTVVEALGRQTLRMHGNNDEVTVEFTHNELDDSPGTA